MREIVITAEDITIRAILNDTAAAKDFEKRLPFTCSGFDSGIDYCCSAEDGQYDSGELQTGWKNGDISLGGGWFAILYGGEEKSGTYKDMMIIGHILDDDLGLVKKLPERVTFNVEIV